jgi:LmbE family N-acetylglucosaminyl deacetylase
MLNLSAGGSKSPLRLLFLGAHSDDIEIGCGGTILRLLSERQDCNVRWVVFSSTAVRKKEALRSANLFLERARERKVVVHSFRDGFFPHYTHRIKEQFERLKPFSPDLILTHCRSDLHQDHRVICELTWNTFRNHLVLEYEIPKYDGDLGSPNCFVPLSKTVCDLKIKHLMNCFKSQAVKHWFTPDLFQGLMRIRGLEANSSEGFAEAFYARKLTINV